MAHILGPESKEVVLVVTNKIQGKYFMILALFLEEKDFLMPAGAI